MSDRSILKVLICIRFQHNKYGGAKYKSVNSLRIIRMGFIWYMTNFRDTSKKNINVYGALDIIVDTIIDLNSKILLLLKMCLTFTKTIMIPKKN